MSPATAKALSDLLQGLDLFRFPIGTEFVPVGKVRKLHKVIGHRVTLDVTTGEVVRTYYRCSHEFMGQTIESDEVEATVARGVENLKGGAKWDKSVGEVAP